MKFILCIPAYNEGEFITETIRQISLAVSTIKEVETTIIVAENGSTDSTKEKVLLCGIKNVKLHISNLKGKGAAIRNALRDINADIFGYTDADLSVDPMLIMLLIKSMVSEKANLIIGSRFNHDTKSDRTSVRSASSRIFNILAKTIVGIKNRDTQCPIKIMDRTALSELLATQENGWFMDLEFVKRCELKGLKIIAMPITWREHYYRNRKSKLSVFKDGLKTIPAMIRIRRSVSKLQIL